MLFKIVMWIGAIFFALFLTATYISALGMIWYASVEYYETHYWLTISIRVFCSSILSTLITFLYGSLILDFFRSLNNYQ